MMLSRKTWLDSGRKVNPRYMHHHWRFSTHHRLLEEDAQGRMRLTKRGGNFRRHAAGEVVQEIDEKEGLLKVLTLVSELGPAARSDLLEPFGTYVRSESKIQSDEAIKRILWSRLRNLVDRGLVSKVGNAYEITQGGLAYVQEVIGEVTLDQRIRQLLTDQKNQVRGQIHDLLAEMDPIAFEHLVKRLLEELGYEEVEVTAPAGDMEVDVVARIDMGITSVREVVQVKRMKSNISRKILDRLRGVLHRFDAVRGTIITTGGFTKGTLEAAFERGAAPITLIDGDRLLELLTEHSMGVNKKKAEIWELDPDVFAGLLPDDEEAPDAES